MAKAAKEVYQTKSKVLNAKVTLRPVTLQLPPAHPKQYELINAFEIHKDKGVRFVVGACGTKFGKTYGCTIRLVKEAWENKGYDGEPLSGPGLNWWVAPSYAQSKMAYSLVKRLLPTDSYEEYKADLRLILKNPDGSERSIIEFKSGDNPDNLRGFAVNFFILDEAARIPYDSFVSVVTTVTQTRGRGIIISTPKGRGWFAEVYGRGEKLLDDGVTPKFDDPSEDPWPEWMAIRMPTWTNPHVSLDSIREMRRNLPEDVFRQEVAAQFLDDSAGVFKNIKDCIRGVLQPPLPGHRYIMGVDLARLRDYSVITIMDSANRHVVYHERFNQLSWEVQYHRILAACRKYNATIFMDSTGIGDPIVETIRNAGVRVEPYKIGGSQAKQQLIEKLRVNIENLRVSFPKIPALIEELRNYEYKLSESGVVKYSAPSGMHDDCVISLALANWGADSQPWVYRYSNVRGV